MPYGEAATKSYCSNHEPLTAVRPAAKEPEPFQSAADETYKLLYAQSTDDYILWNVW